MRAVRGDGAQTVEGTPSSRPRASTPLDDFPPAAPTGLSAMAATAGSALIWEPNAEPDLAGYLVLRGEAGRCHTALQLTDTVVTETRFTDRTVMPGVRYVYASQAVDYAAAAAERRAREIERAMEETAR